MCHLCVVLQLPRPLHAPACAGNKTSSWSYGPAAECYNFDVSTQDFSAGINSTWSEGAPLRHDACPPASSTGHQVAPTRRRPQLHGSLSASCRLCLADGLAARAGRDNQQHGISSKSDALCCALNALPQMPHTMRSLQIILMLR